MAAFLDGAAQLYALVYFGLVIVMAVVEWVFPRRKAGDTLTLRWIGNLGLAVIDAVVLRWVFPMFGLAWAFYCQQRGWGLMHQASLPGWFTTIASVLLLDLQSYSIHYVQHRVALLWRLHKTHHTDHEFDFTTGLRFHPLESIVTTGVGLFAIALLGAPPVGVLVFQLLTLASALFEHSNLRLPAAIDAALRLVVVTPDQHRVHHSSLRHEAQSNLGAIFPWWDRLFGTYVAAPSQGHDQITFGVKGFSDIRYQRLHWLLLTPFLNPVRQAPPQPPAATIEDTLSPLARSR